MGMSAPPIGITNRTPSRSDAPRIKHSDGGDERLMALAQRLHPVELRDGDERRRAASYAVESRDHLRHRRHLYPLGRDRPDHRTDQHPDPDLTRAEYLVYVGYEDRRDEG